MLCWESCNSSRYPDVYKVTSISCIFFFFFFFFSLFPFSYKPEECLNTETFITHFYSRLLGKLLIKVIERIYNVMSYVLIHFFCHFSWWYLYCNKDKGTSYCSRIWRSILLDRPFVLQDSSYGGRGSRATFWDYSGNIGDHVR